MQIILVAAAVVSALIKEWGTVVVLLALTVLNAVVGMRQEGKAECAMNALKSMMKATARVRRDGAEAQIPAEELVNTPVTNGSGAMMVTATGSGTELGKISGMLEATARPAEGSALADAALRAADDGLGNTPQASLAYLAVAAAWAEQGRLEEARRELLRALQSRRHWLGMSPWATIEIMFRLADVLHGLGDDAGAAALVTEIDDVLTSLPDGAEAQRTRLELLRHRLGTGPGDGPMTVVRVQGMTNREIAVLRRLRGTMSTAEIAKELELSSNTVKTHTRAIYRKLAVSTRPAAVTRARELGLL